MSSPAPISGLERFRDETRDWIQANCPASMRTPFRSSDEWFWGGRHGRFPSEDAKLWFERLSARGWIVPAWPEAYGGAGLYTERVAILSRELRAAGCRPALVSLGITMLAPVLFEFGTEEQRLAHLRPMAEGRIRWCQGFSEPGAGSDLASLRCRAERHGDEYVVSGQKIWTSGAHQSDWIFCLVRTGPVEARQNGITFLLIDLSSPGVTTGPIELISGQSEFCTTTFDDVVVPATNRLGDEGAGWTIAKRLLEFERQMYSHDARSDRTGSRKSLPDAAKEAVGERDGQIADAALRDEVVRIEIDRLAYHATLERISAAAKEGRGPGPETSILKLTLSELNKRRTDLRLRLMGLRGLVWSGDAGTEAEILAAREWLRSKADSIAGGTSEIQLNVIAKRVLGLPSSG